MLLCAFLQIKKEARKKYSVRMKSAACNFEKQRKMQRKGSNHFKQQSVYTCRIAHSDIERAAEVSKQAQAEITSLKEQLSVVSEESQMYRQEKKKL